MRVLRDWRMVSSNETDDESPSPGTGGTEMGKREVPNLTLWKDSF